MSHKKDEVEFRTESVLSLDWVSFEKQTNKHKHKKNPSAQHKILCSDEKVTIVTGEKDQML